MLLSLAAVGICVGIGPVGVGGVVGRLVGVTVWYTVVVRMDCIGVGSAVAWLGTIVTNCLGECSLLGESDSILAAGALPRFNGDGM